MHMCLNRVLGHYKLPKQLQCALALIQYKECDTDLMLPVVFIWVEVWDSHEGVSITAE